MGALAATPARIRHDLHTRLVDARARTDELFRIVREEALYDRPIAERHRIIFYVGHLEAFDWNLLRSEEHTTELQSRFDLVCRLLLEKKKPLGVRTHPWS